MYRIALFFYIVSIFVIGYWCYDEFLQERARLKYVNPKYLKDVVVFTGRKSRRDPYLTNLTGTILMPYGNNVTFRLTLTLASGGDFKFITKACETFKYKWMRDFAVTYTNLTTNKCPIPTGRYSYYNMQLPPKNIPMPIADGDYWIRFEFYVTATKEQILEANTLLRYNGNKNNNKKPKKG